MSNVSLLSLWRFHSFCPISFVDYYLSFVTVHNAHCTQYAFIPLFSFVFSFDLLFYFQTVSIHICNTISLAMAIEMKRKYLLFVSFFFFMSTNTNTNTYARTIFFNALSKCHFKIVLNKDCRRPSQCKTTMYNV